MTDILVNVGTVQLVTDRCIACDVIFAMPASLQHQRRRDKRDFYCPNGHPQCYSKSLAEQEADRLREQLEAEQRRIIGLRGDVNWERQRRQSAERSAAAQKGQATRLRKRIGAGVCPVDGCRRHFQNVQAHIERQHPSWRDEDATDGGAR